MRGDGLDVIDTLARLPLLVKQKLRLVVREESQSPRCLFYVAPACGYSRQSYILNCDPVSPADIDQRYVDNYELVVRKYQMAMLNVVRHKGERYKP